MRFYPGPKQVIVVENSYSGQFYRYMRSETALSVDGHIRKYDGEPFMPHHIVDGCWSKSLERRPIRALPRGDHLIHCLRGGRRHSRAGGNSLTRCIHDNHFAGSGGQACN